jgi:carbamoyl-phosphate synthase / aspartate carbamoyltransferase
VTILRDNGFKTIIINFNPETVSTDHYSSDRLYFENVEMENIVEVYEIKKSNGVVISVGGQAPNNITLPLLRNGVNVLGTNPEMIDSAENRYLFSRLLDTIGVDQPLWKELTSFTEAVKFCQTVSCYVLSRAAMNVAFCDSNLEHIYRLSCGDLEIHWAG